ncbi:MAG: hypothetical protein QME66_09635 [Candidatus Eisenbacteria bacterium]|nr:hypothetical protein [Candidatus Eisenbacteria bacterium]
MGQKKTRIGPDRGRMPDWSPEGNRIVHIRYPGDSSSDIFVMDSSGGSVLRLTSSKATDYGPKFSPDAMKIAFYSGYEGDVAVWIVNSDGSNPGRIITGSQPSWSPDGKKLAFIGSQAGTINDNGTVWVVDIDGTNSRQLTYGPR